MLHSKKLPVPLVRRFNNWHKQNRVIKKNEIKNVQPIKDYEQITDMKFSLKKFCGDRDYILFLLGINTGLRISDLLKLKINEIKKKKEVIINEGKTKKPRTIYLGNIYNELNAYINTIKNSEWLFPSRKGNKPISRIQAYRQLNKAARMIGINEGIGTDTIRKTFGYWYYKDTRDIASLQMILNHSHPNITLKYIGIIDEEIERSFSKFVL